jgi:hypothetical protein
MKALYLLVMSLAFLVGRVIHRLLLPVWSRLPRGFRRSVGAPLRSLRHTLSAQVRHG